MLLKASRSIAAVAQYVVLIGLIASLPVAADDSVVSAVGVVESADCEAQTIKVLGVTFAANNAGNAAAICGALGSTGLRYVSVGGVAGSDGSVLLTKLATLSSDGYVPGATAVYLSGSISEARVDLGQVVLSGAVISFGAVDMQFGRVVEILGTQPILGGVILPTTVRMIETIRPGGAESVADSSIGSGTSLRSSIGSGVSAFSSIGSGKSLSSSIGSGTSLNSSIGSGKSLSSSIGSGTSLSSSIGSGVSIFSSIGSGVQ